MPVLKRRQRCPWAVFPVDSLIALSLCRRELYPPNCRRFRFRLVTCCAWVRPSLSADVTRALRHIIGLCSASQTHR